MGEVTAAQVAAREAAADAMQCRVRAMLLRGFADAVEQGMPLSEAAERIDNNEAWIVNRLLGRVEIRSLRDVANIAWAFGCEIAPLSLPERQPAFACFTPPEVRRALTQGAQ